MDVKRTSSQFSLNIRAVFLFTLLFCYGIEARTWTNSDGSKTFEGTLKSYDPSNRSVTVTLASGRNLTFLQDMLSKPDITYLKSQVSKPASNGEEELPISSIDANKQMGMGFNFGSIFDAPARSYDPRPWERASLTTLEKMVDVYHKTGARNLRIPYTFSTHTDLNTGEIDLSHTKFVKYKKLLDYILDSYPDMWIIVNTHHDDWYTSWDTRKYAFQNFWIQLATEFKDYPFRVIFEIENEPWHNKKGDKKLQHQYVNEMMSIGLKAVRSTGKKNKSRIVMITPHGGQPYSLNSTYPNKNVLSEVIDGESKYIMMTIHFYGPWPFCGPNNYVKDKNGEGAPVIFEELANQIKQYSTWSRRNGIPVNIGELGVAWSAKQRYQDNNIPDRMTDKQLKWYKTVTAALNANELNYSIWDDNGWFKVLDRNTLKINSLIETVLK